MKRDPDLKYWVWLVLALLFMASCSGTRCVSETDKHIRGQRYKYTYDLKKCPRGGTYYRWLWFIKR